MSKPYESASKNELSAYLIQLNKELQSLDPIKNRKEYHYTKRDIADVKNRLKKLKENRMNKLTKLIESIVSRKMTEAKKTSMTPTAAAYFKYLKSLDKPRLLSIASRYHRVNSMDKSTPKIDLVYTIIEAEHGSKWYEKDIRLPEYAKRFLKESKLNQERLKESVELKSDLSNLDQYVTMNYDEIIKNMEIYGWVPEDIKDMNNYYDIAHLLGVDTRLLQDVDLYYVTNMVHGIINDINDEENW